MHSSNKIANKIEIKFYGERPDAKLKSERTMYGEEYMLMEVQIDEGQSPTVYTEVWERTFPDYEDDTIEIIRTMYNQQAQLTIMEMNGEVYELVALENIETLADVMTQDPAKMPNVKVRELWRKKQ